MAAARQPAPLPTDPTGVVPDAVNFPLVASRDTGDREQSCAIAGDLQTYDRTEVEYARRGART